jgi:hypothetical protein
MSRQQQPDFWSLVTSSPKRKYTFQVRVGELPAFLCYSAQKPEISIASVKVNFLNHEFKYPGRVTYNEIELKYYDTEDLEGSTAKLIYRMLMDSGYRRPESPSELQTISKRKVVQPLNSKSGEMKIEHINAEGDVIETWRLKNAWFSKIAFDSVDYSSDDPVSISMTIVYDYPIMEGIPNK